MKLNEITGRRSASTLSQEEWEEGVSQLDMVKDLADSKSDKKFILDVAERNGRLQAIVMAEKDDDGYPSITFTKEMFWDKVTGKVPHYFVFRQANKAMGISSIADHFAEEKDAVKLFFKLLKDTPGPG